ncbi:hypothetical protein MU516_00275 [Paracoccus sp. YLB-12]|uniref:Uncharacterized protein n=1 Tax=Paracoccus maritimus TaxID=2933292 RepID=A0ABT2K4K9_9RHOB|nr:hypothetical protein [Paracoccus sp. YLB-12]MCT4331296.1 hypothetical protein [Paracoccus sp. YLB-12]
MSAQQKQNVNNVIAALQLLGAAPGGAENEPARRALESLGAAMPGRSDPEAPLPGSDRPTWAAFRRLERENQLLIDHAEMLACALGACPNCWGTILDCEDCGGVGRPGAFRPDRSCFDRFVLPVIAQVMGGDGAEQDTQIPIARLCDRDHPQGTSV